MFELARSQQIIKREFIMQEIKKLPLSRKLAYCAGSFGENAQNTLLSTFLTAYYTDTVAIAAAAIGTMYLLARLLDGITDVVMGTVVDKTKTRIGKARPWIILSAPLVVIGIIFLLTIPQGISAGAKLAWAYASYLFLNAIVYTMFKIGHIALLALMSRNPGDRNIIVTISGVLSGLSTMVFGTLIAVMYQKAGWVLTGLVLGVSAGIGYLIAGLCCKEYVGDEMTEDKRSFRIPVKVQLPAAMKNKYFWLTMALTLLALLINANAISSLIYYCNIILRDPAYMAYLMSIGTIPSIIFLCFLPYFSNKFSKRVFLLFSGVLMLGSFVIIGLAGESKTMLMVGTIIRTLTICPMFTGAYAFVADATDYGEWKYKIRSEGIMSAASSVGAKVGIGIGSGLTAWILASAHYNIDNPFTLEVISAIRFGHGWLGVILSVCILICVMLIDVEKYLPQIRKDMAAQQGK
jgi:GPH family glycoside/pentoside/hexuronide:cation symporter